MELLQGQIRDYAWGSRTAIAELQGRPVPSDGPEAELWLGAHPGAPATVDRDGSPVSLTDLLLAEPAHWLGERLVGRFGTRLPFLLKLLAADAPLSLQAHPDAEQARAGYAADAGRVNYVDPYHKPELLVALSEFEALCGFRDPAESAAAIAAFGVPALEPVVAALRTGPAGLREAVRLLLSWPEAERAGLVAGVLSAEAAGPDAVLARALAVDYPADPGVLVALLLHHVRLAPGEAIWMPAGNMHAYLRGTGVEIMAASDNVLRGGFTPKRVDVDELLRVLRFEVLDEPVMAPVPVAPGVVTWPVPVEDFALHRVEVAAGGAAVRLALPGPRVVLCRAGKLTVDDGVGTVTLGPGQAAVGTAAGGPLVLGGEGEAFVATCGLR
ncbi:MULTISPECIES: mannose-6-phosphate isomerase, class I [Micromonospora]|uniref:mannose-6-phosphate isomerase n=1 Tax=Micromonospora solifontis TaxID=2487138 RepID=A0ABX9WJV2_9ACTN|nr:MULTISPECIES: mannose-6-phosphate isomerase, class I [Micromonospora]NES15273.1 mannose-6-phosphate isomerase, class I [Micromonospora sp. PPF5-17B]NES36545.1 mannose-6-phosphate isomerase, class I [Micromonospora solifontis]NES56311.1 mannose-6-phosphate isomerase, class I [Micromonospora sp. PPF5-6]RNL99432.1 mannose-6-phosphate isomerase, class I [Micromonospora solifontis]